MKNKVIEIVERDAKLDIEEVDDPTPEHTTMLKRKKAAQFVDGLVSRKVVKQTVMTSVYGVTFIGARKQIQARLKVRRGWGIVTCTDNFDLNGNPRN